MIPAASVRNLRGYFSALKPLTKNSDVLNAIRHATELFRLPNFSTASPEFQEELLEANISTLIAPSFFFLNPDKKIRRTPDETQLHLSVLLWVLQHGLLSDEELRQVVLLSCFGAGLHADSVQEKQTALKIIQCAGSAVSDDPAALHSALSLALFLAETGERSIRPLALITARRIANGTISFKASSRSAAQPRVYPMRDYVARNLSEMSICAHKPRAGLFTFSSNPLIAVDLLLSILHEGRFRGDQMLEATITEKIVPYAVWALSDSHVLSRLQGMRAEASVSLVAPGRQALYMYCHRVALLLALVATNADRDTESAMVAMSVLLALAAHKDDSDFMLIGCEAIRSLSSSRKFIRRSSDSAARQAAAQGSEAPQYHPFRVLVTSVAAELDRMVSADESWALPEPALYSDGYVRLIGPADEFAAEITGFSATALKVVSLVDSFLVAVQAANDVLRRAVAARAGLATACHALSALTDAVLRLAALFKTSSGTWCEMILVSLARSCFLALRLNGAMHALLSTDTHGRTVSRLEEKEGATHPRRDGHAELQQALASAHAPQVLADTLFSMLFDLSQNADNPNTKLLAACMIARILLRAQAEATERMWHMLHVVAEKHLSAHPIKLAPLPDITTHLFNFDAVPPDPSGMLHQLIQMLYLTHGPFKLTRQLYQDALCAEGLSEGALKAAGAACAFAKGFGEMVVRRISAAPPSDADAQPARIPSIYALYAKAFHLLPFPLQVALWKHMTAAIVRSSCSFTVDSQGLREEEFADVLFFEELDAVAQRTFSDDDCASPLRSPESLDELILLLGTMVETFLSGDSQRRTSPVLFLFDCPRRPFEGLLDPLLSLAIEHWLAGAELIRVAYARHAAFIPSFWHSICVVLPQVSDPFPLIQCLRAHLRRMGAETLAALGASIERVLGEKGNLENASPALDALSDTLSRVLDICAESPDAQAFGCLAELMRSYCRVATGRTCADVRLQALSQLYEHTPALFAVPQTELRRSFFLALVFKLPLAVLHGVRHEGFAGTTEESPLTLLALLAVQLAAIALQALGNAEVAPEEFSSLWNCAIRLCLGPRAGSEGDAEHPRLQALQERSVWQIIDAALPGFARFAYGMAEGTHVQPFSASELQGAPPTFTEAPGCPSGRDLGAYLGCPSGADALRLISDLLSSVPSYIRRDHMRAVVEFFHSLLKDARRPQSWVDAIRAALEAVLGKLAPSDVPLVQLVTKSFAAIEHDAAAAAATLRCLQRAILEHVDPPMPTFVQNFVEQLIVCEAAVFAGAPREARCQLFGEFSAAYEATLRRVLLHYDDAEVSRVASSVSRHFAALFQRAVADTLELPKGATDAGALWRNLLRVAESMSMPSLSHPESVSLHFFAAIRDTFAQLEAHFARAPRGFAEELFGLCTSSLEEVARVEHGRFPLDTFSLFEFGASPAPLPAPTARQLALLCEIVTVPFQHAMPRLARALAARAWSSVSAVAASLREYAEVFPFPPPAIVRDAFGVLVRQLCRCRACAAVAPAVLPPTSALRPHYARLGEGAAAPHVVALARLLHDPDGAAPYFDGLRAEVVAAAHNEMAADALLE